MSVKQVQKLQSGLKEWLKLNPKAPATLRHVTQSLAGDNAVPVWRSFGTDETTMGKVLSFTRHSYENAMKEVQRPTATDELGDIAMVRKLAKELARKVKGPSFPANLVTYWPHLDAEDSPRVQLAVGWRSMHPDSALGIGYVISITDVLNWIEAMADSHLATLNLRAGKRRPSEPIDEQREAVKYFVRHLAWSFGREFGQEKRTVIAQIANAVFEPAEPLDRRAVDARLKDRPEGFDALPTVADN